MILSETALVPQPPGLFGLMRDREGVHVMEHALIVGTHVAAAGELAAVRGVDGAMEYTLRMPAASNSPGRLCIDAEGRAAMIANLRRMARHAAA
eukprot:CAMPEP_0206260630 /NCGR_PEP_ID=MMETSP0047_2-20121206/27199_1 /ASSEMBLY_ACC=CAM_ASM_000192 /TAXON_ID=195065 /ORGANISM="Chroomonas mesostigmatica_cf, Strain CCMP1168" /LENGTH=93 /DNA_ID=CAMNT_0053687741 /DNA_START=12 /DNA_END=290 /DNA_ORIENTATION=+